MLWDENAQPLMLSLAGVASCSAEDVGRERDIKEEKTC